MILTAHQPAYLPWLGFFEKVHKSDVCVLLDSVQFETNSYINRNKIYTPHGEVWLTVPCLTKKHIGKTIQDIKINNNIKWGKKHWMSLYMTYNKAPYFHLYSDFLKDMYDRNWIYLADMLKYQLGFFFDVLKIDTKILNLSDLGITSKKQQLILDMCKMLSANKFIFGKMGKNYIDTNQFSLHNVEVEFQNYEHPIYNQNTQKFVPYMSIVDLLFNEGPQKSIDIIMGKHSV